MYNIEIKFVTPIQVKLVEKSIENMFNSLDCPIPVTHKELEHIITMENVKEIPDEKCLKDTAKTLNEHFANGIKNAKSINAEVCGKTTFVGFTKIEKIV